MNKKTENKAVSPWQWVPSLYFAQGIPYVVVMSVAVILFKRMGMSNTDIALYTSGLNLPWVIKPLWSPLVDLLKTKRWWIVVMQILVGAGLAGIALTIQGPQPAPWKVNIPSCFSTINAELYRWDSEKAFRMINSLPMTSVFLSPVIFTRINLPDTPRSMG